ncbi:hypothetical protein BN165_1040059 [Clostridioides difficile E1]|nr:hypothetical protein BN165_1040059 [Clostridioides difficile E1]
MSSFEGFRLPLGWLWNKRMEAAFDKNAAFNTSLGCTSDWFSVPILMMVMLMGTLSLRR